MKKLVFVLSLAFTMPGYLFAAGLVCNPSVDVVNNAAGTTIRGATKIRWDATPTAVSEYVSISGYANSTLTVRGRDDQGDNGFCQIPVGNPLYNAAMELTFGNGLGNGNYIYAMKGPNSNTCLRLFSMQHSCYLN